MNGLKPHLGLVFVVLTGIGLSPAGVRASNGDVDYQRDIKPLLKERCYACHGALKQNAGLRLDTAKSLLAGGDSGAAVVSGRSDKSLVVEAVTGDLAVWRMPPEGEPLTKEQIDSLRRWIDQGAPLPEDEHPEPDPRQHWAFQAPQRPDVPLVKSVPWAGNRIDAFLTVRSVFGRRP